MPQIKWDQFQKVVTWDDFIVVDQPATAVAPELAVTPPSAFTRQLEFSPEIATARPPAQPEDVSILDAITATPDDQPPPWFQAQIDFQRGVQQLLLPSEEREPPGPIAVSAEIAAAAGFVTTERIPVAGSLEDEQKASTRFKQAFFQKAFNDPVNFIATAWAVALDVVGLDDTADALFDFAELETSYAKLKIPPGLAGQIGGFLGFFANPLFLGAFGIGRKATALVVKTLGGRFGPPTVKLLIEKLGMKPENARRLLKAVGWVATRSGEGGIGFGGIGGIEGFTQTKTVRGTIDGIIEGVKIGVPLSLVLGAVGPAKRILGRSISEDVAQRRLGLAGVLKPTEEQLQLAVVKAGLKAHPNQLGGSDLKFSKVFQAYETLVRRTGIVKKLEDPVHAALVAAKKLPVALKAPERPPGAPIDTKAPERLPTAPGAKVPTVTKEPGLPAAALPKPPKRPPSPAAGVVAEFPVPKVAPGTAPKFPHKAPAQAQATEEAKLAVKINKATVPADFGALKAKRKIDPEKLDLVGLKVLAEVRGVFVAKSATRKQLLDGLARIKAESGTKPNSPMPPIPPQGARRGLLDVGPIIDTVNAGLKITAKAGKWATEHTAAAGEWVWMTLGGAVSKLGALKALIAKFGEGIRKRFPGIWAWFRKRLRGIKSFAAGGIDTGRLTRAPAPQAILDLIMKGLKKAKPLRTETKALFKEERAERAARITRAQNVVGGVKGMFESLKAMEGEFPRPEGMFQPLEGVTEAMLDKMLAHIWRHRYGGSPQGRTGIQLVLVNMVRNGYLPTDGEINFLTILFGEKFGRALLSKKYGGVRLATQIALDLWNTPKSLKASWDFSAVGRQGLPATLADPIYATEAMGLMVRSFGSERFARLIEKRMRRDPYFAEAGEDGLFLASILGSKGLLAREELFTGQIIQKIPGLRVLVRPSERAFLTYLNLMRLNTYKQGAVIMKRAGVPRAGQKGVIDNYKRLARFVNASTGRGNINLGELGAFLNGMFFSPRLLFSHFEYPVLGLGAVTKEGIRNVATRQLIGNVVFILTIAGLLKSLQTLDPRLGIKLETDPRSNSYLKVILGDRTTIDLTGGRARTFSLLSQMVMGQKTLLSGETIKQDMGMSAYWYAKGKLSPSSNVIMSIQSGRRFGGKSIDDTGLGFEFPYGGLVADLIVPITFENFEEMLEQHGATGLWLMGPEIMGFGSSVIPETGGVVGRAGALSRTGLGRTGLKRGGLKRK